MPNDTSTPPDADRSAEDTTETADEPVIPTPAELLEEHAAWELAYRRSQVREAVIAITRELRSRGGRPNASSRALLNEWAAEVAAAFKARGWCVSVSEASAITYGTGRSIVRVGLNCPECDGSGIQGSLRCGACSAEKASP